MNISETEWENLVITTALLLGAPEPVYDDYGHPERAQHRKYWRIIEPQTIYANSRVGCFERWIARQGFKVKWNGDTIKLTPRSNS